MGPPLPAQPRSPPVDAPERDIVRGSCVCGHASYALDITPAAGYLTLSAYCHCTRCQRIHAAPFIWTTHWKHDAVTWTCPGSHVASYEHIAGVKYKLRCAGACGVQLGTWNESKREWSIWPEALARDDIGQIIGAELFRPTAHQFYGEWRVMHVDDGLPQYVGYEGQSIRVG